MKNKNILLETDILFDLAVGQLNLSKELSLLLRLPYREVNLDIPVRDINGDLYLYKGYRVQHNGARGPYYGAIDLVETLDIDVVKRLASRTVWKTALMNIPFGGSYGGISLNKEKVSPRILDTAVRSYVQKISSIIGPYKDILACGKNADESIMARVMDEYTRKNDFAPAVATGKPETLSGTVGSKTALVSASYYLLDLVSRNLQMQVPGLSMALSLDPCTSINFIEYLNYLGCTLVAISDSNGAVFNPSGFDMEDLRSYIIQNNKVYDYSGGESISASDIINVDCDILLLGLNSAVVDKNNAQDIKAKILLELDDALVSIDAEPILYEKGTTVVPDLLVLAGKSVVDYFEWIQNIQQFRWNFDQINEEMAKYINDAFKLINSISVDHHISYRQACYMAGINRVAEAISLRGYV